MKGSTRMASETALEYSCGQTGMYLEGTGQTVEMKHTDSSLLKQMTGLMNGQGRFEWMNGDIYCGTWKNGQMWGKGTKIQADGSKIEGEFVEGHIHGWASKVSHLFNGL